ncbi:MAG: pimeloyl-ACP methyl ester esterase BioH [Steroidobacteraceae bacterium]|nr:pimeloyl-ACP methyl ester esterase BioH [Steroidobacteraceae bacterium]
MSLHVEVRGQGPDLVLLHGWALHGGMWGPWLEELALHARLHLVDLPGHGHSPWAPGLAGLANLARAVGHIVPRGAVLVGWSLGGMIALELARQEPQRASAMVLLATTPRFVAGGDWPHGMDATVLDEFAQGLADDHRGTVQNFLALQARGDERALDTLRLLRRNLDAHGPPDPRALAAGLEILRTVDLRHILPGIALPALVIAGQRDRLTPAAAGRALASALPTADFVEIAHGGHAPFLSHGRQVLDEVLGFLHSRCDPVPLTAEPA